MRLMEMLGLMHDGRAADPALSPDPVAEHARTVGRAKAHARGATFIYE